MSIFVTIAPFLNFRRSLGKAYSSPLSFLKPEHSAIDGGTVYETFAKEEAVRISKGKVSSAAKGLG